MQSYYNAVRSSSCLLYRDIDVNSGRCRISRSIFKELSIKLGWIVQFTILVDEHSGVFIDVLCTAWPNDEEDDCDYVCIDDAVVLNQKKVISWNACKCIIKSVHPPNSCTSLNLCTSSSSDNKAIKTASVLGLPLCSNATISIVTSTGIKHCLINNVYPGSMTVATINSIVTFAPSQSTPTTSSATTAGNEMNIAASNAVSTIATTTTAAMAMTSAVQEIIERIVVPCMLRFHSRSSNNGRGYKDAFPCTTGMLLLGSPGTGKSYSIRAVKELCHKYCNIITHEVNILSMLSSDEPLAQLEALLASQYQSLDAGLPDCAPAKPTIRIIIIDEIDALGTPANHTDIQSAIKSTICSWFDREFTLGGSHICIIGTSNIPSGIDPCFKRGGRLEYEVEVIGSVDDRVALLKKLFVHYFNTSSTHSLHSTEIDSLSNIVADTTGGYVSADLQALMGEAYKLSLSTPAVPLPLDIPASHTVHCTSSLTDTGKRILSYCEAAKGSVTPSCLRGAVTKLPAIKLSDVIGYDSIKKHMCRILSLNKPVNKSKTSRFNIQHPGGILLHGPPGNSKTRLVIAAASEYGFPVISLSAADVYSPYVGDAEAEIRKAFRVARQALPCVLFIDELDALVTDRSNEATSSTSNAEARVLATFLVEMDGVTGSSGCIVIGTTNRVDSIDSALLRKGRFHHVLHVPPPDSIERIQLLEYFSSRCSLTMDDVQSMTSLLRDGMSGADIELLCKERGMDKIRHMINTSNPCVH